MLLVLYNGQSGKGKGAKIANVVKQNLTKKSIDFEIYKDDQWPNTLSSYKSVWLIGGDGSINYFLNKYPQSDIPIGLFPGGTGNDFYSNVHSHSDIDKLVDQYLNMEISQVDVGICNGERFINTIGIGFDGEVLKDMSIARWIGGHIGYLIVVIKHLFTFKELQFNYEKGGKRIKQHLLLFFISNAPTTGGGFIISPNARIDDGKLHVVTAKPTHSLKRLFLLPKVEKGTHLSHPRVSHWTTSQIKVDMEQPTLYQIDGELKCAQHFDIHLKARSIKLLT